MFKLPVDLLGMTLSFGEMEDGPFQMNRWSYETEDRDDRSPYKDLDDHSTFRNRDLDRFPGYWIMDHLAGFYKLRSTWSCTVSMIVL